MIIFTDVHQSVFYRSVHIHSFSHHFHRIYRLSQSILTEYGLTEVAVSNFDKHFVVTLQISSNQLIQLGLESSIIAVIFSLFVAPITNTDQWIGIDTPTRDTQYQIGHATQTTI